MSLRAEDLRVRTDREASSRLHDGMIEEDAVVMSKGGGMGQGNVLSRKVSVGDS